MREKIRRLEFGIVKEYDPASGVLGRSGEFLEEFKNMSKKEKKKYCQDALNRQSNISAKS